MRRGRRVASFEFHRSPVGTSPADGRPDEILKRNDTPAEQPFGGPERLRTIARGSWEVLEYRALRQAFPSTLSIVEEQEPDHGFSKRYGTMLTARLQDSRSTFSLGQWYLSSMAVKCCIARTWRLELASTSVTNSHAVLSRTCFFWLLPTLRNINSVFFRSSSAVFAEKRLGCRQFAPCYIYPDLVSCKRLSSPDRKKRRRQNRQVVSTFAVVQMSYRSTLLFAIKVNGFSLLTNDTRYDRQVWDGGVVPCRYKL